MTYRGHRFRRTPSPTQACWTPKLLPAGASSRCRLGRSRRDSRTERRRVACWTKGACFQTRHAPSIPRLRPARPAAAGERRGRSVPRPSLPSSRRTSAVAGLRTTSRASASTSAMDFPSTFMSMSPYSMSPVANCQLQTSSIHSRARLGFHFPLALAFPFVVQLFPLGHRQLQLDPPVLQIHLRRNQRQAFFTRLAK